MSNIEQPSENNEENPIEKPEIIPPQFPKNKTQTMFQELEIMAMQKGNRNTLDLSKLDKKQIDKVLDTIADNEKNAFAYHTQRLNASKEIKLRQIDASAISQNTIKIIAISSIIGGFLITGLILLFKETYFIPWLTFLTGLLGGIGLSNITNRITNSTNNVKDDTKQTSL